jgi:hypothetical protein
VQVVRARDRGGRAFGCCSASDDRTGHRGCRRNVVLVVEWGRERRGADRRCRLGYVQRGDRADRRDPAHREGERRRSDGNRVVGREHRDLIAVRRALGDVDGQPAEELASARRVRRTSPGARGDGVTGEVVGVSPARKPGAVLHLWAPHDAAVLNSLTCKVRLRSTRLDEVYAVTAVVSSGRDSGGNATQMAREQERFEPAFRLLSELPGSGGPGMAIGRN